MCFLGYDVCLKVISYQCFEGPYCWTVRMRGIRSFTMSQTTHPMTQHHISEYLKPWQHHFKILIAGKIILLD